MCSRSPTINTHQPLPHLSHSPPTPHYIHTPPKRNALHTPSTPAAALLLLALAALAASQKGDPVLDKELAKQMKEMKKEMGDYMPEDTAQVTNRPRPAATRPGAGSPRLRPVLLSSAKAASAVRVAFPTVACV